MINVENILDPPGDDTYNAGNECGIRSDLTRLLKCAAGGECDPAMLPAGLDGSGLTEVLTKISDTRKAIDKNPLPAIAVDADLNFMEPNDAAPELFGWEREEVLRMNIRDVDVLDVKCDNVAVTVREKRFTSAEAEIRCPDVPDRSCIPWNTGICNTNDSAAASLRRGENRTYLPRAGYGRSSCASGMSGLSTGSIREVKGGPSPAGICFPGGRSGSGQTCLSGESPERS